MIKEESDNPENNVVEAIQFSQNKSVVIYGKFIQALPKNTKVNEFG